MNASAIAAALADRAEAVCRHYLPGGRRQGRFWIAGDINGTPGRSLYVRLTGPGTPGKWTDAADGSHGDLLDIVRHRSGANSLPEALNQARTFLALPHSSPTPSQTSTGTYDTTQAAQRLWSNSRPIAGTHAQHYLRARSLLANPMPSLRFHPALRYRDNRTAHTFPALIAAVTDNEGTIRGVQRTWLDRHQPIKAPVPSPRKALGRVYSHAVRLVRHVPGAALIVGEGIETVLSLTLVMPTVPSAAALSAGSLAAFTPPHHASHLIIAADNDHEGQNAADRLHHRTLLLRIPATIILPQHADFNDDLHLLGHDALATRTRRQLHQFYAPEPQTTRP